jgi:hypothetical protein
VQVELHVEHLTVWLKSPQAPASVQNLARTKLCPKRISFRLESSSTSGAVHDWRQATKWAAALAAPEMRPVLAGVMKLDVFDLPFSRTLLQVSTCSTRHPVRPYLPPCFVGTMG